MSRPGAYAYQGPAGILEFSRDEPFRFLVRDASETPVVYESYFTVFDSPSAVSLQEAAKPILATVDLVRRDLYIVRDDLQKGGQLIGRMDVYVIMTLRGDGLPKIAVDFTPAANASASTFIVWAVRVPSGTMTMPSDERISLAATVQPASVPLATDRVRVSDSRPGAGAAFLDWSDAKLKTSLWIETAEPKEGTWLQVRFPVGEFRIDPTVGSTSSEKATAYSSQRKLFFHNGVYWAFWFDSSVKYAWSKDGFAWGTASTVPNSQDITVGFDVALVGDTVGIVYVSSSGRAARFLKGQILYQSISWNQLYSEIQYWDNVLYSPTSLAMSSSGFFASFVSSWTGAPNYRVYVYRSEDAGATWAGEVFYEAADADTVPLLATGANSTVYATWASKWTTYLKWKWFGAGGWSGLQSASAFVNTGFTKGDRVSAVAHPDGRVHVAFVEYDGVGDWSYLYLTKISENTWTGREGPLHTVSGTLLHPSISADANGDDHVFFVAPFGGTRRIHYVREGIANTFLPATTPIDPASSPDPAWLSVVPRAQTEIALVWTRDQGASWQVDVTRLPLPSAVGPASFEPWTRSGLSPYQSYFSQLADAINPGTGMLTVKQDDLVLPGRGLDVSISRMYQEPRVFLSGLPYLHEVSPYANVGPGWSLNFPWVGESFLHLWDGQTAQIDWDQSPSGTVFVSKGAEGFRFVKTGNGYELYAKSGTKYEFEWSGKIVRIFDLNGNVVTFNYVAGRLDNIVDAASPVARVVTFGYDASNRLWTVSTGARTVTYGYNPSNQLTSASDPMSRTTTFLYSGTTGANAYLLTRVTYPTGGNTRYTYDLAGIKTGTEALSFPVTLHEVWLPAGLARSTSYSYEAAQGRVEFVKLTLQDATAVQGYTEYDYRTAGLYTTQTKYDASYGQLEKMRSWYGAQGAPTQTDLYAGSSATPTHSSTVLMDEWGNQISGSDPLGHEAFASYANTATENGFRGAGQARRVTSGKILYDTFDDFSMSDWSQTGTGGSANIDSAVYDPSSPGIKVQSTATLSQEWMVSHSITAQSGGFWFDAHVRPGQPGSVPGMSQMIARVGTSERVVVAFRENLQFSLWSSGGSWTDCASYEMSRWYRVTLDISAVQSAVFNVYLDGIWVCASGYTLGTFDNVAFKARAVNSAAGQMWVDEVKVYQSSLVTLRGLRVGQVAELTDPNGVPFAKIRQAVTYPNAYLDSHVWDPDVNAYRAYEFGTGNLKVYSVSRTMEYVSPFRDFWGGDTFVYSPPVEVASLARVESGFGRWQTMWLDDYETGPVYNGNEDGWTWRSLGEAGVLGPQFHRSPWRVATHTHSFQDWWQLPVSSGQFHVQYVRINGGQYPAEVMLEYRVGTGASSWEHRAYWGGNYIMRGVDGTPSRLPMGAMPYRPDEWVMLIVKADDIGTNAASVNGLSFDLYGGAGIWDVSALGDANTGLLRVSNLTSGQKVELTDPAGAVEASATVPPAQTSATLDMYGADLRAFPYKGRIKVYAVDGTTLQYVSPVVDVFGGDRWAYTPSEFYVNSVNTDTKNRVVGNLAYRTSNSLDANFHSDMGSYATYDVSFSGNHGSWAGIPSLVTGIVGSARRLDGVDDGIWVPDASSLDTNTKLTISVWIKPEAYVEPSTSNRAHFVSKWNNNGQTPAGQFVFGFSGTDGKLALTVAAEGSSTGVTAVGLTQVPLNVWSHVAVVYNEGQYAFYRNGLADGSGSLSVARLADSEYPNDDLWIGRLWSGSYEFTGSMDELIVMDRVLPADDVAVIYRTQYWTAGHPVQKSYTKYTTPGLTNQTKAYSNGVGLTTYNEFDTYGSQLKVTDPLNRVITYGYSATYGSAYMTSISEPLGVSSSFVYDFAKGMRTQETSPLGGLTDNTYDNLLRILTTTYSDVGGTRHSISYAYNDPANTMTITDELGHQIRHTFDAIGRETKVERLNVGGSVYSTETFVYDWQDRVASQTTATGLTYTTQYDLLGRVTRVTNPDTTFRTVAYDDVNNLVTATDEMGRQVRYRYDWGSRLIEVGEWNAQLFTYNLTTMKYDGMGSVVSVTDSSLKTTTHAYDNLGRLTVAIYPDAAATYEKYTYDKVDNLLSKKKRDGTTISFTYDSLNRLKTVTYPGQTVTYDYDKMGNTKKVVNSIATLWYEYDARNRMTKESALVGGTNRTILYGYDGASNLISMTYPDGTVYTYTPDAFNRVSSISVGGGALGLFTYRTDDRIGSVTFGNGVLTSYAYDNRARPDVLTTSPVITYQTLRPNANGDSVQWQKSGTGGLNYDRVDEPVQDGDATFVYATSGTPLDLYQLTNLQPPSGAPITTVTIYAYAKYVGSPPPGCPPNCPEGPEMDNPDPAGSIALALKTNGQVRTSTTFALQYYYAQVMWEMTMNPVTGAAWTEAEVDALQAGAQLVATTTTVNVTQVYVSVRKQSTMSLTLDYGYNAAGDVTNLAITPPTGSPITETFRYDGQDRLDRWTSSYAPATTHAYAFNSAGDRTSLIDNGQTTTYAYNNDHQLDSYAPPSQGWNVDYDKNGNAKWRNQTTGNTKWVYTYDTEDRLTQVQRTLPVPPYTLQTLGTYSYDGLGRRVKTVEGSTTTYFVYSGLSLVQTTSGSTTTRFVYASGLLVARTVSGTTSYLHQDPLGSVRATSDGNGNWAYVTQYKPFGQEYATSGSSASLKYTGQWKDANTGLYYLYRRFYDPDLGRFLSPDPILGHLTVPQSLDRYLYTVNNPLRYVDPTGEDFWSAVGAALNAVGQALSKINPLDLLDMVMMVIGFIPGLDIISDAYSLLRAVVDVAMGKGTWADVAMAAVFLLLPVGGSYFKAAKKASNVVEEGSSAVRQVGTKVDDLAEGAKGAAKSDEIGDITKRLDEYKDQAVKNAKLTEKQSRAAAKNPALGPTFFGERVDFEFRKLVKSDDWLTERVKLTPRGKFGPDVTLKDGGTWWDVTTSHSWARHEDKYGDFGRGIPLLYQRP